MSEELQSFKDIFAAKQPAKKPPTYQWQDLALQIIKDLGIPPAKRNSVFQVCKKYDRARLLNALNDTKELAQGRENWRYFFKIIQSTNSQATKPTPKGAS